MTLDGHNEQETRRRRQEETGRDKRRGQEGTGGEDRQERTGGEDRQQRWAGRWFAEKAVKHKCLLQDATVDPSWWCSDQQQLMVFQI